MRKLSAIMAGILLAATATLTFAAHPPLDFGPGRDGTQAGKVHTEVMGAMTKVTLDMTPGTAGSPQPAHIHVGTCPGVGAVKYPLTSVVNGKSETIVNTTMAELASTQYSINVHLSVPDAAKYTACVNLPLASASLATSLPRTGGFDGALILLAGAGLAAAGGLLRRR